MNICIVTENFAGGGAERVVSLISSEFVKRGNNCTIITNTYSCFAYQIASEIRLLSLYTEKQAKYNNLFKLIFSIRNIRALVRENNFDVIIAIMPSIALSVFLATVGISVPIIASDHTAFNRKLPLQIRFIRRFIYPLFDAVTILTHADYELLKNRIPHKVVIPNPLALEPCLSQKKEKIILGAGRLDVWYVKGFDLLIKAWGKIASYYPDWTLVIAGGGSERSLQELKLIAKECNIEDRVSFVGFKTNIGDLMKESSIYVLSSRIEGFGLTLLEAMSQSCACISFDSDGRQQEILRADKDGILVKQFNETVLSDELKKLIENDELRGYFGRNAYEHSQDFSLSKITDMWLMLLKKICDGSIEI